MRTRAALLASILLYAGVGRCAPITVETIEVTGKNTQGEPLAAGQVTMPFIRAGNAAVANQINDALFLSELGMPAPKHPGKSLAAGEGIHQASQGFTISGADGRVLSVNFEIEGCGAYCETYHSIHNFDTSNGRRVDAEDILTVAGTRELVRQMTRERLSRFHKQMAIHGNELKAAAKRKSAQKEEIDDLNERIALNRECAGREKEKLADGSDLAQQYTYYTQEHANNSLQLTSGRCSNHAMRALDEVGDVGISIPYARLRPYLTSYGKALLLGEGSAKATGFSRQVLHGHLNGNIAITMRLLKESGNQVTGSYMYDRFGKLIELAGTQEGDEVTLTERLGEEGEAGATMKLVVTGSQLKGQWIGKKQFTVQLAIP